MTDIGNKVPPVCLDLMVDIETLGTKPGCVVLSAAGVWFSRGRGGEYLNKSYGMHVAFNHTYMLSESLERGLTVDPETAKWWFEQPGFSRMARRMEETTDVKESALIVEQALDRAARVWSCGPDFDPPILSHALGIKWPFWKNRDVRTMKDVANRLPDEFATHDPLEDCFRQIKIVQAAWRNILRD